MHRTRESAANHRGQGSPVAAYLRASTDKQETSVPAQRKAVQAYADEHGYWIVEWYVDDGISGDATEKRFAFQRMLADAQQGKFVAVICWDQDRFGRFDPIEGGYWIKPLRDAGVRLETVAQGVIDWSDFAGRIVWSVQQEAKHAFLRDMSRNVLRGQIDKALQGKMRIGVPPFGYDKIGGILVPNADADVVRQIFADVLDGVGLKTMAKALGMTRRGKPWSTAGIRFVIRNPVYRGAYSWGRRSIGKYHRFSNGGIEKSNGQSNGEPIIIEGSHEPIVSPETWHAAQAALTGNRWNTAPTKTYAFSGVIVCGHCGGKMHGTQGHGRRKYICNRAGFSCAYRSVREDELVVAVLEKIGDMIGTPKKRKSIVDAYRDLLKRETDSVDVAAERRRLASLNEKLESAASRILEVDADLLPIAQKHARRLKDDRDAILARIASVESAERKMAVSMAENVKMLDDLAGRISGLHDAPADALRRLFRNLLTSLSVRWDTISESPKRYRVSQIHCVFRHSMLQDL